MVAFTFSVNITSSTLKLTHPSLTGILFFVKSLRGTLGIILLAKKEGRLSQVQPFLEQLVQIGFRVSPAILAAVLQLAGEE